VAHAAPALPGPVRRPQQTRSSPAVLLPRGGTVALPGPGCARECSCHASALLPALAAAPLLIELWHHDKYTQDVLLGVASVDLSEVLSARPDHLDGERTVHQQQQTVPFVAPAEELLPDAPHGGSAPAGAGSARHVALLDVTLRLDLVAARPPRPPRAARSAAPAPAHAGAASACLPSSAAAGRSAAGDGGSGGSTCGAPSAAASATAAAQLAAWRRREEAKFKAQLAEKEEAHLSKLTREWNVYEARCATEPSNSCRLSKETWDAAPTHLRAAALLTCRGRPLPSDRAGGSTRRVRRRACSL
jgi:hypothetical protein